MIEFNGSLTGSAEKFFWKKSNKLGQQILLIVFLLWLPGVLVFWLKTGNWKIPAFYLGGFILFFVIGSMPKRKSEREGFLPYMIIAEEDYLVCEADQYVESKRIDDVKVVYDYGEFYDIVFPFGKVSEKFVCQKSLLAKGSLEEFEGLFEGKIVRKI